MAISKCISLSSENKIGNDFSAPVFRVNETGYHGTPDFPVAVYLDDVSNEYVNWHWHEEFEIGYITEGPVTVGCGNRKYALTYGDIFFVNSNVLHSMHKNGDAERAVFKSIAFDSSLISSSTNSIYYTRYVLPILFNSNFRDCIIREKDAVHKSMLDCLVKAWNLVYDEVPDYEILVRNELSILFCLLNRFREEMPETVPSHLPNYLPEKRVQVLLDYIHTHYRDKITIEDLAKAASISKTEVLRSFRTIMGLSPINYLNSYRLQTAAHLLANTNNSIQEIAESCGFDDNSYFSKLFKKKYHVSPHEYRL